MLKGIAASDGIGIGIVAYVIGCITVGRQKEIELPLWILFAIFLAYFVIHAVLI